MTENPTAAPPLHGLRGLLHRIRQSLMRLNPVVHRRTISTRPPAERITEDPDITPVEPAGIVAREQPARRGSNEITSAIKHSLG